MKSIDEATLYRISISGAVKIDRIRSIFETLSTKNYSIQDIGKVTPSSIYVAGREYRFDEIAKIPDKEVTSYESKQS